MNRFFRKVRLHWKLKSLRAQLGGLYAEREMNLRAEKHLLRQIDKLSAETLRLELRSSR